VICCKQSLPYISIEPISRFPGLAVQPQITRLRIGHSGALRRGRPNPERGICRLVDCDAKAPARMFDREMMV
jgi:hypothetical protein